MRRQNILIICSLFLLVPLFAQTALASDAEMYFASDKLGETRVKKIREGESIWLAVHDPDENTDCDVRDKVWTDVKVIDAKTGAYIVWDSRNAAGAPGPPAHKGHFPGPTAGSLNFDYLEETDANTGLFISSRPFQVGTRASYGSDQRRHSHIVGPYQGAFGAAVVPTDFQWGGYLYADFDANNLGDNRVWVDAQNYNLVDATAPAAHVPPGNAFLPGDLSGVAGTDYVMGRFENMDTIMGLYQDQDDDKDVAATMAKIVDTKSLLQWGKEIYKDANGAAKVIVTDDDENLNCNAVESVPVFIIVNPGSWNPRDGARRSATNFCMLKRYGGVTDTAIPAAVGPGPIDWFNIYDSGLAVNLTADGSNQPNANGSYYIQYPNVNNGPNVVTFDTASNSGVTRAMFYARETGANTGVFQLQLNNILRDLGFNRLDVGDVLVAYYVDPNDQDDFSLATSYIEARRRTSITRITDAFRNEKQLLWLGRDPVYVEVKDANANVDSCCPEQVLVHICDPHEVDDSEWLLLDEISSNSQLFFSNQGVLLAPVWDALGVGLAGAHGGYQLRLDNWRLEGFNEDRIYARYNDVTYTPAAMAGVGDLDVTAATGEFPPTIRAPRVDNDVSFGVVEIADTQVFDGENTYMYFLDRQGNRVFSYLNSDCVFVEVIDPDQDEDQNRRERIAGYWDSLTGFADRGQNIPFAPVNAAPGSYPAAAAPLTHPVNDLLGYDNMFDAAALGPAPSDYSNPKLYVLNPRNGLWTEVDLLETEIDSGDFVSATCIDLVSQYANVPTLGVLPGDTIIAMYQDPSNHSDTAWITIKVAVGGVFMGQASTTMFVDAEGSEVASYSNADDVYVMVIDSSNAGETELPGAVEIAGTAFDLAALADAEDDTFITETISLAELGASAGDSITAIYTDPNDPTDSSSDTVSITVSKLEFRGFLVKPNPISAESVFAFDGVGTPASFSVVVYDLSGHRVWSQDLNNAREIPWNAVNQAGVDLANGSYIYVATATDGIDTYHDKGKVFILR